MGTGLSIDDKLGVNYFGFSCFICFQVDCQDFSYKHDITSAARVSWGESSRDAHKGVAALSWDLSDQRRRGTKGPKRGLKKPPVRVSNSLDWVCDRSILYLGGSFKHVLFVSPIWVKWSNLTNIFQMGWNHQVV